MITTVSSNAALDTALRAAQSGDTILLSGGNYALSASSLHFATGLTIASADLSHQAVLTGVDITSSSGITLQDVELYADPAGLNQPFRVTGSDSITLQRMDVHGSLDGDPQNDLGGFLIRTSTNVTVADSKFQQLEIGISQVGNTHLTIRGNEFHDLRMDGVRGGGSSYVNVTGNTFHDFHPFDTDHPDAVQFWTTSTTTNAHDILIADNLVYRGGGDATQGFFFGNEASGITYERVTISGNYVSGARYHGITLSTGRDATINDNIVQGFSDQQSWIRVDNVNGATLTNNQATQFKITSLATNVTETGDTVIPLATDGGAAELAIWQAAHSGASVSPTGLDLLGTAGSDTLTGGDLADTLTGLGGTDLLTGGAGDDLYVIDGKASIVEALGGGFDAVRSSVTYTLPNQVESLTLTGTGNAGATGNSMANVITGNAGANLLQGRFGTDTLVGGAGADTLKGGDSDDQLTGGSGADVFSFAKGEGHDVIHDFGAGGEHDVIDVSLFYSAGSTATLAQVTAGVKIHFSSGETILVEGVQTTDLHPTATGWVF